MSAVSDSIGDIFDNYSDVIEGGNAYASGTEYKGIPGTRSIEGNFVGTTVTANGAATDAVPVATTSLPDTVVQSDRPPVFLLCTAATNDIANTARKITAIVTDTEYSVGPDWAAATTSGDTFDVVEGFKRLPDNLDIMEADFQEMAFDRYFQFSAEGITRIPWYGNNVEQYESTLILKLALAKHKRARNWRMSAFENITRMRTILTKAENRDGTYVQLLTAEGTSPTIDDEDEHRIVISDEYRLVYRVAADHE